MDSTLSIRYTPVQKLLAMDLPQRVCFCEYLLQTDMRKVFWADNFQHKFSINVWEDWKNVCWAISAKQINRPNLLKFLRGDTPNNFGKFTIGFRIIYVWSKSI